MKPCVERLVDMSHKTHVACGVIAYSTYRDQVPYTCLHVHAVHMCADCAQTESVHAACASKTRDLCVAALYEFWSTAQTCGLPRTD